MSCLEPSIHLLFRDETWIQRSRTDDMEQITDESKELTLDLWLAKDNRFLNPKSSYKRILMAPPCRLIQKKSQKKPTWSAMWITFCWDRKRFQSTASRLIVQEVIRLGSLEPFLDHFILGAETESKTVWETSSGINMRDLYGGNLSTAFVHISLFFSLRIPCYDSCLQTAQGLLTPGLDNTSHEGKVLMSHRKDKWS